ncbi:MAG: hypothetical protein EXR62_03590 [Chloroflexi bacterium]|nr:hypothetical protein [Chloroflexota bacterium]
MWRLAQRSVWRGYGEAVRMPGGDSITVRQVSGEQKQCATCRRVIGAGELYVDLWNNQERHRFFCVNHAPAAVETRVAGQDPQ